MTRRLPLGPLTIVHDEGLPFEVLSQTEDADELPADVCEDLLSAPSVINRCAQQVEDEPVELDFE